MKYAALVAIACLLTSIRGMFAQEWQNFDILRCFTPCNGGFTGNEVIPGTGCAWYHQCWKGVPGDRKACGGTLVYNLEFDYCDYPWNVNCLTDDIECPTDSGATGGNLFLDNVPATRNPTRKPTRKPRTKRPTPRPTKRTTPRPTERTTSRPTNRTTPRPTERTTPRPTERTTPRSTRRPIPRPSTRNPTTPPSITPRTTTTTTTTTRPITPSPSVMIPSNEPTTLSPSRQPAYSMTIIVGPPSLQQQQLGRQPVKMPSTPTTPTTPTTTTPWPSQQPAAMPLLQKIMNGSPRSPSSVNNNAGPSGPTGSPPAPSSPTMEVNYSPSSDEDIMGMELEENAGGVLMFHQNRVMSFVCLFVTSTVHIILAW